MIMEKVEIKIDDYHVITLQHNKRDKFIGLELYNVPQEEITQLISLLQYLEKAAPVVKGIYDCWIDE